MCSYSDLPELLAPPHSFADHEAIPANGSAAGCAYERSMSALGQKRTLGDLRLMSALPPKADMGERNNRDGEGGVRQAERRRDAGILEDKIARNCAG